MRKAEQGGRLNGCQRHTSCGSMTRATGRRWLTADVEGFRSRSSFRMDAEAASLSKNVRITSCPA